MKKRLMGVLLWACLGVWSVQSVQAETVESNESWKRGLDAFAEGDSVAAERAFQLQLDKGLAGAEVYYNLGVTQTQQGKTAAAMLSYSRALAIDPRLQVARQAMEKLASESGIVLPQVRQPQIWVALFGGAPFWIAGSVFGWVGLVLLAWGIFSPKQRLARVASGVILTLLGGASLGVAKWGDPLVAEMGMAVVQTNDKAIPLRSNPVDNAPASEQLKPGSVVGIIAERGRWVLVRLPGGKEGWLPRETIVEVVPGGGVGPANPSGA